jgi:hypothetical protein
MNSVINFVIKLLMMKIIFSFCFFFTSLSFACRLTKPIISLSAPVTDLLEKFNLLQDPLLKGISVFHSPQDYKGKKISGGIFLSEKELIETSSQYFIDQSLDLRKKLNRTLNLPVIEVKTHGIDPFKQLDLALGSLSPLLERCEKQKEDFLKLKNEKRLRFTQAPAFKTELYFFLGEKIKNRWPSQMMVHDGPVKWWINHKKVQTYKTSFAYVPWSEKWKQTLKGNEKFIFLVQSQSLNALELKIEGNDIFIRGPKVLAPGWGQIEWMEKLVDLKI